jgi:hypothetical protein
MMSSRLTGEDHPPGGEQVEGVTKIAAIVWYMPDDYPVCRAIMTDGKKLPPTHAAWWKRSESQERRAILEGYQVYRVPLAPEAFQQWCREREMPLDARGRVAFAVDAIRNRHAAASARKEQARLSKTAAQSLVPANSTAADPPAIRNPSLQGADAEARQRLGEICAAVEGMAIFQVPDQLRELVHYANDAVIRVLEEKAALEAHLEVVENEAARLAEFNMNASQYVKVKISPNVYIYQERNPAKFGNALSFCPNCFERKRISILEGHPFGVCRVCNFRGQISWRSHN